MEKLTFLRLRGIFSHLPVIRSGAELLQKKDKRDFKFIFKVKNGRYYAGTKTEGLV